ncbi:MAG TPA: hypothetical protein DD789_03045 [Firmicutes bacterium]|nr:hypothetical protein [Bacillota bacterium]
MIESMLRDYYKKKWKLHHIALQIKKLNEDIEEIKQRIGEGINIIRLPGVARGVPAGAANRYSPGLEKSMVELEETLANLKTELGQKVKKRDGLEMKKRALEEDILADGIDVTMNTLSETEKQVLEQKFVYRRNFISTGTALHMSESAARYWYRKAIERFGEDLTA